MSYYASNAISLAEAEVGYLEKATNTQLDDKTVNAGSKNYTKYARDLATAGFFNGSKQGYAWCAVFVTWVAWKLCGKDRTKAMDLLCQTGPYGAGSAVQYYKQSGRFYTTPLPGDQIFFWNEGKTSAAHTGMVYKVDDSYVYTIEGNTSGASGVVANGGGVFRKKYNLNYHRICGYGRPKYDAEVKTEEEEPTVNMNTLKKGDKGAQVTALQALLIGYGYSLGRSGVDGDFGSVTEEAVRKYQSRSSLTPDGIVGRKTWGKLLGVS